MRVCNAQTGSLSGLHVDSSRGACKRYKRANFLTTRSNGFNIRFGVKNLVNYAIVQTGGKQYRVQKGDTIRVESLPGDDGEVVDLDEVVAITVDDKIRLGTPTVPGAKVVTEIVGQGKVKKVVVFKYKAKTRYRRKKGHRQSFTDLSVTNISFDETGVGE